MIEDQARVIRLDGDFAEIIIEKQPACGTCSVRRGCGTSLLAHWFPRRRQGLRLKNTVRARPGDTVLLGLDGAVLQRSSLLLYAVPLAGLLGGSIAGERGFRYLGHSAELGAVLFGLLGVITALIAVRQRSRAMFQGGESGVRLLRVVRHTDSFEFDAMSLPGTNQSEGFETNK